MSKRLKELVAGELTKRYGSMDAAMLVNVHGLSGVEANTFRNHLRKAGAEVHVIKNSIATRVFKGTPLEGYYNADKEKKRQAVNKWIRESGEFDAVIDFDAVVRNPDRPTYIQAQYDAGDHLHPNDAGYKAMAESIDLKVLMGGR